MIRNPAFPLPGLLLCLLLVTSPLRAGDDVVYITGERVEGDAEAGQITVITAGEWERKGARTVAEAVDLTPGVTVSKTGTALDNTGVIIRGAGGEQVLIMIDGVPLNNSQGDAVNLNSFSLNGIEEIRIIRGGNSAVYGEGAFGGVINLITAKEAPLYWEGDVYARAGAYDTYAAGGSLRFPLDPMGTLTGSLSGEFRLTEGDYEFGTSAGEEVRTNSDGRANNLGLTLEWNMGGMDRNILTFNGSLYSGERGLPGLMEYLTPDARLAESRLSLSGRYRYRGYGGLQAEGEYSYVYQDSFYDNPDSSLEEESRNGTHGGRLDLSRSFDRGDWQFAPLAGVRIYRQDLTSSSLQSNNGTALPGQADQSGGSAYGRIPLSWKGMTLTPAYRWDWWASEYLGYNSRGDRHPSWSFSLSSPVPGLEKVQFKGNLGTAYNSPGFDDLFWSSGSYATGNPDLLPEESLNWDSGLTCRPAAGIEISLVYFESYTENLIQWLPSADGTWSPSNVGQVVSRGIESSLDWLIPLDRQGRGMIDLNASYSWLRALDMTSGSINRGNLLAYRPEHSGSAQIGYVRDRNSLSLATRYFGQRFTNGANTKFLEPVLIFDATAKFTLPHDLYLSASLLNLGDVRYIDKLGYPIPGREWSLTGGYRF